MHKLLLRSSFILLLFVSVNALLSSCKNNSTNPPPGTAVTDTLTLSMSGSDTIVVRPGQSFSIALSVGSASSKTTDSAAVNYVDPILTGTYYVEAHHLPATVTITDTVPTSTDLGVYAYSFTATTPLYANSHTITVYVKVVGRSFAKMNLRAHAVDPSSIALAWSRPLNDRGNDTLVVWENGTLFKTYNTADSTQTVSDLQTGTVYTFFVLSSVAYSDTIQWATAERFSSIRLYETADGTPGHFAGLVVSTGDSVSTTGPDAETADIVLATDSTSLSNVSVVSPALTSLSGLSNGKNTKFSDFSTYGSLDYIYYHSDTNISNRFKDGVNRYEVPSNPYSDFVFEVLTADNHYAQVELESQPDGQIVGGSGSQHFVDIVVSYQPTAGAPYVGRPQPLLHGLPIRTGKIIIPARGSSHSAIKTARQN